MNRLIVKVLLAGMLLVNISAVLAKDSEWPRTLPVGEGMVTIYALQVDDMNDDIIRFRAALAYRETPDAEPVFGAGWFESQAEIDARNRIVHPTNLKVTDTRFPDGFKDMQSDISGALAQQSASWNLDFSLDELESSLESVKAESKAAEGMNTTPPQIIYRDRPALLVSFDGEPILRAIENSPHQAVINTPYPLISDGNYFYLNAAKDVWYRATSATGPYRFETKIPEDIASMVDASEATVSDEQSIGTVTAANAPEVVVSTVPAELIVTDGPAAFVPLIDDLLVLQNSEDDVFMHVSSQNFYIVLAGRWYQAKSLNGPWSYQSADKLPMAFANIPEESDQADSRVYVAGTKEARDAVLDAQVPKTAAIERGVVEIDVEYDGEPFHQPVDGTDLVYIENTGATVLLSQGLYYLVENGVWYVAPSPNGPWQVSDHRPEQVESILPTSPVYNVKYVHVYHSTPNVVYVGYTPGYVGSYVYHNTIFYGSGWHHRPWVSPHYYYPRLATWGFHASYNPWSGWNYGLSWGWGPFSISYYSGGYWHHGHHWHHRHYGRWGPRGYRHRPVHHGKKHHGKKHQRYAYDSSRRGDRRQRDYDRDRSPGNMPGRNQRGDNLYRDESQQARLAHSAKWSSRISQSSGQGRSAVANRRASDMVARNSRNANRVGIKNGERNRTGPVDASELRLKASVRDINSAASREKWFADTNGNVYRGTNRVSDLRETVSGKNGLTRNSASKTSPQLGDRRQYSSKNARQNEDRSYGRKSGSSSSERRSQSTVVASVQRSVTRSADNQERSRSSRSADSRLQPTTGQRPGKRDMRQPTLELTASTRVRNSARVSSQREVSNDNHRKQSVSGRSTTKQVAKTSVSQNNGTKRDNKRESRRRSKK